jgi:hypothetical protein
MALGTLQDRELNKFTEIDGKPVVNVKLSSSDIAALSGGSYQVNNLEDSDPLYVGKVKTDGVWLIEKFIESTGAKTYANLSNNGSIADYTDAWTNRATLTYNRYDEITGV